MEKLQNYIGGELCAPAQGEYLDNYEPAKGEVYSLIPRSGAEDVAAAVKAAEAAFPAWSALSNAERSKHLMAVSNRIAERLDELAMAESRDNGKPFKLAQSVDIPRARDNFAFFATAILHQEDEFHNMGTKGFNYTLRQPLGSVACISPWNLPLYLLTWKIAPALVSGNCVIAKPSEMTPYTAYLFSKICINANLPPGVLNILHGSGKTIGKAIVKHSKIKAISFTGGTDTGKEIAKQASHSLKKISLEMGGKNPVIIFDDCDYNTMIDSLMKSSFLNQGQICLAGSRIYIQKKIYEKFKKDFITKIKKLVIGNPLNKNTDQGAIISRDHLEKISKYIEHAKKEGAKIITGGYPPKLKGKYSSGWYFKPTVIEKISQSSIVNQNEIFGPVVTLNMFENEKDVIKFIEVIIQSTLYSKTWNIFPVCLCISCFRGITGIFLTIMSIGLSIAYCLRNHSISNNKVFFLKVINTFIACICTRDI